MLDKILTLLDNWHFKKKNIVQKTKTFFIKERDIVFINMGQNIGVEQDGKGSEFLRPVIVYKKFNNSMFLGVPITSTIKDNKYYYSFEFKSKTDGYRTSTAILSQIKAYDTKRVKFRLGIISKKDFNTLYNKMIECIKPKDIVTPCISKESPEGICKMIIPQQNKEVK
jgi:mRNA interferase MazF